MSFCNVVRFVNMCWIKYLALNQMSTQWAAIIRNPTRMITARKAHKYHLKTKSNYFVIMWWVLFVHTMRCVKSFNPFLFFFAFFSVAWSEYGSKNSAPFHLETIGRFDIPLQNQVEFHIQLKSNGLRVILYISEVALMKILYFHLYQIHCILYENIQNHRDISN